MKKHRFFKKIFFFFLIIILLSVSIFFIHKKYPSFKLKDSLYTIVESIHQLFPSSKGENIFRKELFHALSLDLKVELEEKTSLEKTEDIGKITILTGGPANIVYYNQSDSQWADKIYGAQDTISIYGCGPTALAMVVSSLTSQKINPEQMANWAYQNGYFCRGSGSYHSLMPEGSKKFGLTVTNITDYSVQSLIQELSTGKIIIALMNEGHFTSGGHFLILRGVTLEGKILIADPKSLENSLKPWDPEIFIKEAKYSANSGGPFWAVEKK